MEPNKMSDARSELNLHRANAVETARLVMDVIPGMNLERDSDLRLVRRHAELLVRDIRDYENALYKTGTEVFNG